MQTACCRYGMELAATDSVGGMYGGMTPYELRHLARTILDPASTVPARASAVSLHRTLTRA